jgi:DNA gyrase subunit B
VEPQQPEGLLAELQRVVGAEPLLFDRPILISEEVADLAVDVALVWTMRFECRIVSYANGVVTTSGGMHVEGLKKALTRSVISYGRTHQPPEFYFEDLLGEDIREGMNAVVRIKCREPQLETHFGQGDTKTKWVSLQARAFTEWATRNGVSGWLDEHPIEARLLLDKTLAAAATRMTARKEWDRRRRRHF